MDNFLQNCAWSFGEPKPPNLSKHSFNTLLTRTGYSSQNKSQDPRGYLLLKPLHPALSRSTLPAETQTLFCCARAPIAAVSSATTSAFGTEPPGHSTSPIQRYWITAASRGGTRKCQYLLNSRSQAIGLCIKLRILKCSCKEYKECQKPRAK